MITDFFSNAKKGAKLFGEHISAIVNLILLTFAYFIGIGLTFIFAKIFNKHFLDMKIDKKVRTYWTDLNLNKKPMEEYYRQF